MKEEKILLIALIVVIVVNLLVLSKLNTIEDKADKFIDDIKKIIP